MSDGRGWIGGVLGAIGAVVGLLPAALSLEQQLGLGALFYLRGPETPPPEMVTVAISRDSADAHGLPVSLREWPRRLHAELIDTLRTGDPAAIVFDIAFEAARDPAQDSALAAAIARAGNVILLSRVQADSVDLGRDGATGRQLRQIPVLPDFAGAALGTGPFTLPTVPIRTSQFWVFGAGDADNPMLPALAVQARLSSAYPLLIDALDDVVELPAGLPRSASELLARPDLQDTMRTIRRLFVTAPGLESRIAGELATTSGGADIRALLAMYAGPATRYLNFYGPSGTIDTVAFHDIVGPSGADLAGVDVAGKIIFVGFSESEQSEQQDEFISVYSEDSGLSLSGVEIAATAFANLMERRTVYPLPMAAQIPLLLFWGLGLVALFGRLGMPAMYAAVPVIGTVYMFAATWAFARYSLWLPLVVPLLLQMPVAVIIDTLGKYRRLAAQRERLRQALGPYAVPAVVDRLARDTTGTGTPKHVVQGTCLVTDVSDYTSLAERLAPQALADLMDEYFRLLGSIVVAHGGTVGDIAGDSMVALWVSAEASAGTSRRAVDAARQIDREVGQFNRRHPASPLNTPIGVASGTVALSFRSSEEGQTFRPVGDIVNTAARIQGLNRVLGTRMLVSSAVQADLGPDRCRRLGRFRLRGKHQALDIFELLPTGEERNELPDDVAAGFDKAIAAFEAGDLARARAAFGAVLEASPQDGPSRFFVEQCDANPAAGSGAGWDGTVNITSK